MQTGYFHAAWQDIKNSPGWFGKLVLLGLLSLIPIFGWLVVLGYLYGWARDIAWNVQGPMPKRIFGNEDGKLYSRGFFAMVIGFVFMLAPGLLEVVWGTITGLGTVLAGPGHGSMFMFFGLSTMIFTLGIIAASFFATLFSWVGSMRMSIYNRLGAGFQIGKIWAMIRHDFGGILRIFGITLLISFIVGVIAFFLTIIVVFFIIFFGMMMTTGNVNLYGTHPSAAVLGIVLATGGIGLVLLLLCCYVTLVMTIFTEMVTLRALGYWTQHFDVPSWRGQDDPMPFEFANTAGYPPQQPPSVPPTGQPPMQG